MTAITETVVTAEFTPCTFAGPRTWEVEKINIHFLLCASRDGQVLGISLFNLLQVSERDGGEFRFIDKEPKAKLSNFILWWHN